MPNHIHLIVHVETPNLASLKQQQNQLNKPNIKYSPIQNNVFNNDLQSYLKETPNLASLQCNRKITLINYGHNNHPDYFQRLNKKSKQLIPKIIQQYKSAVTKQINPKIQFFGWQPRFYDQIIKTKQKYLITKKYIQNNVLNWSNDPFHR